MCIRDSARLLRVLDRLVADLGLRLGLAVLVGLDRAGRAVGGLALGHGAAVLLGRGLAGRTVLTGGSLDHRAVGFCFGFGGRFIRVDGRFSLGCATSRRTATASATSTASALHQLRNTFSLLLITYSAGVEHFTVFSIGRLL